MCKKFTLDISTLLKIGIFMLHHLYCHLFTAISLLPSLYVHLFTSILSSAHRLDTWHNHNLYHNPSHNLSHNPSHSPSTTYTTTHPTAHPQPISECVWCHLSLRADWSLPRINLTPLSSSCVCPHEWMNEWMNEWRCSAWRQFLAMEQDSATDPLRKEINAGGFLFLIQP